MWVVFAGEGTRSAPIEVENTPPPKRKYQKRVHKDDLDEHEQPSSDCVHQSNTALR